MMKKTMIAIAAVAAATQIAQAHSCDKSLANFPPLPGESAYERLQRAVNALPEGSLYIPSGLYVLDEPLMITNRCSVELNRGATLRAGREMPFVVKINARPIWKTWNQFFNGGIIDGDGLASCLALDNFSPYYMSHVTFLNGCKYGLRVNGEGGGGGIFASQLYFRCLKSGLAGNTAIHSSGGDGTYDNCLIVDWTVGMRFSRSGGNRITGCHAWGGILPPVAKGRLPEMLEDSVCFWLDGCGDCSLRDCYADTALVGYRIDGWNLTMDGCWFFNNPSFKLRNSIAVEHLRGTLAVSGGHITLGNGAKAYSGVKGKARASFSNVQYNNATRRDECPGQPNYDAGDRNMKMGACERADDWEYVPEGGFVYTSAAGEFAGKKHSRGEFIVPASDSMNRRFPKAGPGRELVIRARATTPDTKRFELTLTQTGGKTWGCNVELTAEWKETRLPLSELKYFSHWKQCPKIAQGEQLDVRDLSRISFCYGTWLGKVDVNQPHGFEVSSIRITGR